MKCGLCGELLRPSAKFCPECGTQRHVRLEERAETQASEPGTANSTAQKSASEVVETILASAKKSPAKYLGIVGGSIVGLLIIASLSSGSSEQTSYDPNGITLVEFGCSFGTTVASAIVRNNTDEALNAFVTVGLYGDNGTLQWDGSEYGMVEARGTRLINVTLGGYQFTRGDCKIINVGY